MNNDSFNDSDEIFNLYSTKKVTATFKAQFEKLAADAVYSPNDCEKTENVSNALVTKENNCFEDEIVICKELNRQVSSSDEPICLTEDFLDIDHSINRRVTRRSLRIRNKRASNNISNELGRTLDIDSPVIPTKRTTTRSRKGRKKKKIDEIILMDSPKSTKSLGDDEDEELNPEVTVKVIWKSVGIKKFNIRKFQKFSKVFEELSVEENIPQDKIILTLNSVRVDRNDTPDSLNLHVYHFLDGGVVDEVINSTDSVNFNSQNIDDNCVTLKFQDINKKIVKIALGKKQKMKVGMIKYSEQMEIPLEKIKFYLDGELLDFSETPDSLGIENEELIDIKISDYE